MRTLTALKKNYDLSLIQAINSFDKNHNTYYLDQHHFEGKTFYAICLNEKVISVHETEEKAKKYFEPLKN